eukprot:COSAG01_NODE_20771_length_936_cov_1.248507_1_plen_151_part_10
MLFAFLAALGEVPAPRQCERHVRQTAKVEERLTIRTRFLALLGFAFARLAGPRAIVAPEQACGRDTVPTASATSTARGKGHTIHYQPSQIHPVMVVRVGSDTTAAPILHSDRDASDSVQSYAHKEDRNENPGHRLLQLVDMVHRHEEVATA